SFCQESVEVLRAVQEGIEVAADEYVAAVDAHQQLLQEKHDAYEAELDEMETVVDAAFMDAGGHAEQVVDYSLEQLGHHRDALADELADMAANLGDVVERLTAAVAARTQELQQAAGGLDEGLGETDSGLGLMNAALDGVKQLMASFSFVSF
ncbi:MAG TPA: hypothetical protein VII13_20935, partial [Vicinamibacteria bacterium]